MEENKNIDEVELTKDKNVLKEAFFPSDYNLKHYLVDNLLVPILKKSAIELASSLANSARDYILDAVHVLLGEERKKNSSSSFSSKVLYNESYRKNLARFESRYREGRDSDVF